MKKKYWIYLILIIAEVAALVFFLIPGKKANHDWDDDDDEGNGRRRARTERIEQLRDSVSEGFSDRELVDFPKGTPPVWGGNSPAFHKEVLPGVVVSARENAFSRPTEVTMRGATQQELEQMQGIAKEQCPNMDVLIGYDVNAGLQPFERMPGTYQVEFDLNKLGIPQCMWHNLRICRIGELGQLQLMSSKIVDGKLAYQTDCNSSGWFMGFFRAIFITNRSYAWSALTLVPAAVLGYINLRNMKIKAYFKKPEETLIMNVEDNEYGNYNMGFQPSDTEHPHPKRFLEIQMELEKRIAELQDSISRYRDLQREIGEMPMWIEQWGRRKVYQDSILVKYMTNDSLVVKLLSDPDWALPESIDGVIRMISASNRYLTETQGLKPVSEMCEVYLGDATLTDGGAKGSYHHFGDVWPYLAIDYKCMIGADKKVNHFSYCNVWSTSTHELFHHYQRGYVLNSLFKDQRMTETTAVVLERQFNKWLLDKGMISQTEYPKLDGSNVEEKKWLLSPLVEVIIPGVGSTQKLLDDWKAFQRTLDKYYTNAQLKPDTLNKLLNEAGGANQISRAVLEDLAGIATSVVGGFVSANTDCGYALGDFLWDLLQEVNPNVSLHSILSLGMESNFAKQIASSFNITYEQLYERYEVFCEKHLKNIISGQSSIADSEEGRVYWRGRVMETIKFDATNCVKPVKCWKGAGPFACRTAHLAGDGKLNFCIIPHIANLREAAVKATLVSGDTLFAPNPYYLSCDSNAGNPASAIALLYTHRSIQQTSNIASPEVIGLTEDDYFNVIALYMPEKSPSTQVHSNGDCILSYSGDKPKLFDRLKDLFPATNGMMTADYGIAFTLVNNKTGKEITRRQNILRFDQPLTMRVPDYQAGEQPDITAYAQWYLQPDVSAADIYYSPRSEKGEEGDLFIKIGQNNTITVSYQNNLTTFYFNFDTNCDNVTVEPLSPWPYNPRIEGKNLYVSINGDDQTAGHHGQLKLIGRKGNKEVEVTVNVDDTSIFDVM